MSITAIGSGDGALVSAELLSAELLGKLAEQLANGLNASSAEAGSPRTSAHVNEALPVVSERSPIVNEGLPNKAASATVSSPRGIPAAAAADTVTLSPEYRRVSRMTDPVTTSPSILNSAAPLTSAPLPGSQFDRMLTTGDSVVPSRQAAGQRQASQVQTSQAQTMPVQPATKAANVSLNTTLPQPVPSLPVTSRQDVAQMVMADVATADLAKLTRILQPAADPALLDSLLNRALQEVAKGNAERAVGYLADYATRDPQRAEALPSQPGLDSLQSKIDSMMNRMTIVARMSAETSLSRAEQIVTARSGKMADWETHADVLVKLAHRFYEAGGYANYSRSSDVSRLVTEGIATSEGRPARALAASAAASSGAAPGLSSSLAGMNAPYWASADVSTNGITGRARFVAPQRYLATPLDDVIQNLRDVKEITALAMAQLWSRAPLLFLLSAWFLLGLMGGIAFAIGTRIWSDGLLSSVGNFAFDVWGVGFLALVCFGFYARVRQHPRR